MGKYVLSQVPYVHRMTSRAILLQLVAENLGRDVGRSVDGDSLNVKLTFNLEYRTRFPLTQCHRVLTVTDSHKGLKHCPLSEKETCIEVLCRMLDSYRSGSVIVCKGVTLPGQR